VKYLLISLVVLLMTGCIGPKTTCENKVLTVAEVGGCVSDLYGNGSCGAMLDDGTYARLIEPVKGEKIHRCITKYIDSVKTSYVRAD
jgi:hypothetical protein